MSGIKGKSNPASRLLEVVERVKSIDPKRSTENAWAYALKVPFDRKGEGELIPEQRAELMRRLGHIQIEIDELESSITHSIPTEQHRIYLRHISALRQFAAITLWTEPKSSKPELPEAAHSKCWRINYPAKMPFPLSNLQS